MEVEGNLIKEERSNSETSDGSKDMIMLEEDKKEKPQETEINEKNNGSLVNYHTNNKRHNRVARICYDNLPYCVMGQSDPNKCLFAKILCQKQNSLSVLAGSEMKNSVIWPKKLGMLPSDFFTLVDFQITLYDLHLKYFARRTTKRIVFTHKLYNALKITKEAPKLNKLVGVWWKTADVFIVDVPVFGAFLGSSSPESYLCHESGEFQKNGFENVTNLIAKESPEEVSETVQAYRYTSGNFTDAMTEDDLNSIVGDIYPPIPQEDIDFVPKTLKDEEHANKQFQAAQRPPPPPPRRARSTNTLPPQVAPPGVIIQGAIPSPQTSYVSKKYKKGLKTAVLRTGVPIITEK